MRKCYNTYCGVFWLNIAKNRVYCCYSHYSMLFSKMRRETEFWQHRCQNWKKKYERRKLSDVIGREKKWISVMILPKFIWLPKLCPWSTPVRVPEWFTNLWIVATKLLKMGGKKKKRIMVAKIWGGIKKKKNVISTIFSQ